MKRGERIEMLKEVARRLSERDWSDIDLILRQFNQPTTDQWFEDRYSYSLEMIGNIDEELLAELHDYMAGSPHEIPHKQGGPWKEGWFRLFLGHVSHEKVFLGDVKESLAVYGIEGFVAHADIEPSREWQTTIEVALGTCDAFAAFLHQGFKESHWTDQEVGYGLARRIKIIPLIFDVTPYGFMGRWQGARCRGLSHSQIARLIFEALKADQRTKEKLWDGVVTALGQSQNYYEANDRGYILDEVDSWPNERLERLEATLKNSQVEGAYKAAPRVKRILNDHRRDEPPAAENVPF